MPDLKQIRVFIASPGDVALARERVRRAVERTNRLVAKHSGFLLEPVGWEDIPPARGKRTQEVMNLFLDTAQIFIGILHQRFGNPTGLADSGTEEEFNRIESRWETEQPNLDFDLFQESR